MHKNFVLNNGLGFLFDFLGGHGVSRCVLFRLFLISFAKTS